MSAAAWAARSSVFLAASSHRPRLSLAVFCGAFCFPPLAAPAGCGSVVVCLRGLFCGRGRHAVLSVALQLPFLRPPCCALVMVLPAALLAACCRPLFAVRWLVGGPFGGVAWSRSSCCRSRRCGRCGHCFVPRPGCAVVSLPPVRLGFPQPCSLPVLWRFLPLVASPFLSCFVRPCSASPRSFPGGFFGVPRCRLMHSGFSHGHAAPSAVVFDGSVYRRARG